VRAGGGYKTTDFVEEMRQHAPKGVDVVFDGIGGRHVWRSRKVLRKGGRVIAYGLTSSLKKGSVGQGWRSRLKGVPIIASYLALASLLPGRKRIKVYSIQNLMRLKPQFFRDNLTTLFQLLAEKEIKPMVARRFTLADAEAAHRLLASGTVVGKIVLICADAEQTQ
jgi:NADPH2:quinone reductase